MRGARGAAARRAGKGSGGVGKEKKKKSAGLFVAVDDPNAGILLLAEPLDFLGHGETTQRRFKRFLLSAMVVYGKHSGLWRRVKRPTAFFLFAAGLKVTASKSCVC